MRFRTIALYSYSLALCFLFLTSSTWAGTVHTDIPEITILVYDDAKVPQYELAEAERQAAIILRGAGIKTMWINCSRPHGDAAEDCHRTLGPDQFVVRIVHQGQTSKDSVFGVAFLAADGTGKYSDVFFDRIANMYRECGGNLARLLGTVAAHEIGHLLLGSHAHSPLGIMSARWSKNELRRVEMGTLQFSPDQASHMRERIQNWLRQGDGMQLVARTASNEMPDLNSTSASPRFLPADGERPLKLPASRRRIRPYTRN